MVWGTGQLNCLAKAFVISLFMSGRFGGTSDTLTGIGFETFAIDEYDYAYQHCWVTLVGASFNGLRPFISVGFCNVVTNL